MSREKTIIQQWRGSEWSASQSSVVSFVFAKTKTGTRLTFVHKGVPADDYTDIKKGWYDYYWKPMKEMLAQEQHTT